MMPMIRTRRSFGAPLVRACTGTNRCRTAIPAPGVTALQRRWHRSRRGNKRPSINHPILETTRSNACTGQKSEPRCRSWRRFVVPVLLAITLSGQANPSLELHTSVSPSRKALMADAGRASGFRTPVGSGRAIREMFPRRVAPQARSPFRHGSATIARHARSRGINHEPPTNQEPRGITGIPVTCSPGAGSRPKGWRMHRQDSARRRRTR